MLMLLNMPGFLAVTSLAAQVLELNLPHSSFVATS